MLPLVITGCSNPSSSLDGPGLAAALAVFILPQFPGKAAAPARVGISVRKTEQVVAAQGRDRVEAGAARSRQRRARPPPPLPARLAPRPSSYPGTE